MIAKVKALVKRNKLFYLCYYYFGSFLLRLAGLFVKTDPNLILFISYGGQKYDDSPRVLYEYLLKNPVSADQRYVWAFINPEQFPEVENKVKVDTPAYYMTALRAGYWITNSSASRGLNFRKKQTKNYLFQHGMAGIKKIGIDVEQFDKAFRINFHENFDCIFVEGKKEVSILARAWQMSPDVFRTTGLPRNDDLVSASPEEIVEIKSQLGIPEQKKVILYAPTFREFSHSKDGWNALGLPINFERWEDTLGGEYVLVITAHYEVAKLLDELPQNSFVYNAFKYPVLNDLLKIADILISDYSSVVFDYSILERPILCYGYDYDSYVVDRGLYTDLDKLFFKGVCRTEEELLDAIANLDYMQACKHTKEKIKQEYIASYGNAAEKAAKAIFVEGNSDER